MKSSSAKSDLTVLAVKTAGHRGGPCRPCADVSAGKLFSLHRRRRDPSGKIQGWLHPTARVIRSMPQHARCRSGAGASVLCGRSRRDEGRPCAGPETGSFSSAGLAWPLEESQNRCSNRAFRAAVPAYVFFHFIDALHPGRCRASASRRNCPATWRCRPCSARRNWPRSLRSPRWKLAATGEKAPAATTLAGLRRAGRPQTH